MVDPQTDPLPGDGVGEEHRLAVDFGDTPAVGGVVRDHGLQNLTLFDHSRSSKKIRWGVKPWAA